MDEDDWPPYCCCILYERATGQVFLERRPATARVAPAQLTCFGGKREPGEAPLAAVLRELEEELGPRWRGGSGAAAAAAASARDNGGLSRAVDLFVDGSLIAWFYVAEAPERGAQLTFEDGHSGVWCTLDGSDSDTEGNISPWHACVLAAWTAGQKRADFVTRDELKTQRS